MTSSTGEIGRVAIDRRAPVPTDDFDTITSEEQAKVEEKISQFYNAYSIRRMAAHSGKIRLLREKHVRYLLKGLEHLPGSTVYLDCSRTWILYWILHSLELLGWYLTEEERKPTFGLAVHSSDVVDWVSRCFMRMTDASGAVYGGYGGGPDQLPHLAPTYAAVCSLCILGTPEAYDSIPRQELLRWFLKLKTSENSFRMHEGGEVDVRAIYTCLVTASLLNILTEELTSGVAEYLLKCQTHEGGIGCEPYDEAHGGYTFCGLASLLLLHSAHLLDLPTLTRWVCARQTRLEGGFSGRTNKLVDACYSFWVGATYAMIEGILCWLNLSPQGVPASPREVFILDYLNYLDARKLVASFAPSSDSTSSAGGSDDVKANGKQAESEADEEGEEEDEEEEEDCKFEDVGVSFDRLSGKGDWFFDQKAVQEYLLLCCQGEDGGLRDKPGKPPDYYHTCYALSGMSITQSLHYHRYKGDKQMSPLLGMIPSVRPTVVGDPANVLTPISPIFNIGCEKVVAALKHFGNRSTI